MEKFNIKFVGEVEKYPELYDYTCGGYSRKDVTDKAWNEIAKTVKLSAKECKEKWRNLRTAFVRKMKLPPTGPGTKPTKPYYLHDAMQFAVPFVKTLGTRTGNLDPIPDDDPADENDQWETSSLKNSVQDPDLSPELEISTDPLSSILPETRNSSSSASVLNHELPPEYIKKVTRKRKISSTDADKAVAEYFSAKTKQLIETSTEAKRESIQHFLNSLIPDLLTMTDIQLRAYKRRSLLLIDDILGSAGLDISIQQHSHTTPVVQLSPAATYLSTSSESTVL